MGNYSEVGIRCNTVAYEIIRDYAERKIDNSRHYCLTDRTHYISVTSIRESSWRTSFKEIRDIFKNVADSAPKKYETLEVAIYEFREDNSIDTWYIGDRGEDWIDGVEVKLDNAWENKIRGGKK